MRAYFVLLFLAPFVVQGQTQVSLAAFASSNQALAGSAGMYGSGLGVHGGFLGLRVSGATSDPGDLFRASVDSAYGRQRAWTADADLLVEPTRALPELAAALGGFRVGGLVGLGAQGMRDSAGRSVFTPVASYGGMLSRPLGGTLVLESEARMRTPLRSGTSPGVGVFSRGWEYRVGFALSFGGGPRARAGSLPRIPTIPTIGRPGRSGGNTTAGAVLSTADRYVGTRYVYGGTTPDGFDCSGFIQYVFRRHDVSLPRTSRQMASAGNRVAPSLALLRPGDLVFFAQRSSIDHVAIYAGGNRIVHSSSSGRGVRYDDLSTPRGQWFVKRMVAARRVVADGSSLVRALDAAAAIAERLDPPDMAPRP